MVRVARVRCVLVASIAIAACVAECQESRAPAVAAPRGAAGDRLALLVGISKYKPGTQDKYGPLPGSANDLELMERTLRHPRFGFTGDQIVVLHNEEASLEGFVTTFDKHLLQRAGKGTEIYLYFTGHGSMVPDPTGVEPETSGQRRDSSWLLWDSRADGHDGSRDLTDDVIYSLVHHLTATIGARVIAVTDSCHSGGSLRGGDWTARGAAKDPFGSEPVTGVDGWAFWPRQVPFYDDDKRPERELENYVHLPACANDETAWEGSSFANQRHGMFTCALCSVLERTRAGDPWRLVARRARNMMLDFNPPVPQTPWPEGDLARAVFTGGGAPPADGLDVIPGDGPSAVVRGGRFHGIEVGAEVAVTSWPDGKDRGRIRIEYATYGESMGRWQAAVPALPPGSVLSARIVTLPPDLAPLRVYTRDAKLGARLAQASLAEQVAEDRANYVLTREPLELRTADGIRVWPLARPAPADEAGQREWLLEGLRCEMQFLGFWRLASSERHGELGAAALRFREPDAREQHEPPAAEAPLMYQATSLPARDGETVDVPYYDAQEEAWKKRGERKRMTVLEVTNKNKQDLHLALLSISENREIHVITESQGDRLLAPGSTRTFRIWLGAPAPDAWPADLKRPMRDRYLAIFSKAPLDLQEFVDNRTGSTRGQGSVPGVLRQAMRRATTRGGDSIGDAERGWGVQWLELLVKAPG